MKVGNGQVASWLKSVCGEVENRQVLRVCQIPLEECLDYVYVNVCRSCPHIQLGWKENIHLLYVVISDSSASLIWFYSTPAEGFLTTAIAPTRLCRQIEFKIKSLLFILRIIQITRPFSLI
jgi:hypothetical protein